MAIVLNPDHHVDLRKSPTQQPCMSDSNGNPPLKACLLCSPTNQLSALLPGLINDHHTQKYTHTHLIATTSLLTSADHLAIVPLLATTASFLSATRRPASRAL